MLNLEKISVPEEKMEDAYIMCALLNQMHFNYSLEECCVRAGVPGKDTALLNEALVAYTGSATSKGQMWRLPARYVGPYAEQDAVSTYDLWEHHAPDMVLHEIEDAYRTEIGLVFCVTELRRRGMRVNTSDAELAQQRFRENTTNILKEMSYEVGENVTLADLSSAKRLSRHFQRLQIPYGITRTGQPQFEADWLEAHPSSFAKNVARARKSHDLAEKFIGTYILGFTHNGRVHPEWNLLRDTAKGAKTGRLSSSNPPMQQLPGRATDTAPIIRNIFLPEEGQVFLSADFKSQEPRLAVHFAVMVKAQGWEEIYAAFQDDPDTDLHGFAAKLIGIPRSDAKTIVLGIMYGMAPKTMSFRLGVSEERGQELYNEVVRLIPWLPELAGMVNDAARDRGYIKLIDGAKTFFDMWEPARWADAEGQLPMSLEEAKIKWPSIKIKRAHTRKAFNWLIQGSAARQTKRAMLAAYRAKLTMLASVHDEVDFSVSTQEESAHCQHIMTSSTQLKVPTGVDAEHGMTWGIAGLKKFKTVEAAREFGFMQS